MIQELDEHDFEFLDELYKSDLKKYLQEALEVQKCFYMSIILGALL